MTGIPGLDSQDRAARIGLSAQDCLIRQPGKTARTGQLEIDSWNRIAKAGHPV
jgi:hypothetical protein